MFRSLIPFLLAAAAVLPDVALANTKLVAVLPLSDAGKRVPTVDRETLEETIRTIAGDALVPAGFTVLTGETTLAVLSENGIDANKACEASCSLQAARELKAELFIAGSVTKSEGNYLAFIRLFDVDGKQLSSVKLEGAMIRDLRQQFEEKSESFFGRAIGDPRPTTLAKAGTATKTEQPAPAKTESKIEVALKNTFKSEAKEEFTTANAVYVQFDPPTSTTSWSLVNNDDLKLCDLPCKRLVGPNSGYRLVPGDDSRAVKIQDKLDVALGHTYRARAKLPSRFALLRPGWLGASIPVSALFTLTGLGLLASGAAVDSYDEFDSGSSSSLSTTGVVCLGVGAAAIVWTVFIFKNMRVNGIELSPMDVAELKLDLERMMVAQRSMPVARPIR